MSSDRRTLSFLVDQKMSLEGKGRFWEHTKGKLILYIPVDVYKDSQFPFKPSDAAKIKIEPSEKRMIIEKG